MMFSLLTQMKRIPTVTAGCRHPDTKIQHHCNNSAQGWWLCVSGVLLDLGTHTGMCNFMRMLPPRVVPPLSGSESKRQSPRVGAPRHRAP